MCTSVAADTTTNTTYSALQLVKTSYNLLPSVPSFYVLNTLPGANLSHINSGLGTPLFPTQPRPFTKWKLKCNIKYSFVGSLKSTSQLEQTWSCCGRSRVNFEFTSVDPTNAEPLTPHHLLMVSQIRLCLQVPFPNKISTVNVVGDKFNTLLISFGGAGCENTFWCYRNVTSGSAFVVIWRRMTWSWS